jgi:hypothetical protein
MKWLFVVVCSRANLLSCIAAVLAIMHDRQQHGSGAPYGAAAMQNEVLYQQL